MESESCNGNILGAGNALNVIFVLNDDQTSPASIPSLFPAYFFIHHFPLRTFQYRSRWPIPKSQVQIDQNSSNSIPSASFSSVVFVPTDSNGNEGKDDVNSLNPIHSASSLSVVFHRTNSDGDEGEDDNNNFNSLPLHSLYFLHPVQPSSSSGPMPMAMKAKMMKTTPPSKVT